MAHLSRSVAALRIAGENLVPADVSALLGCEPTRGWAKEDTLASPRVTRTAHFGMWTLEADETEPANLDAQVTAILGRLPPEQSVWAQLCCKYEVDLFCGWFMKYGNEGVTIETATMSALGVRGIPLSIDLYRGHSDTTPG